MKNQLNFEVVSDEELLTTSGGQLIFIKSRIYLGLLLMVNNYY